MSRKHEGRGHGPAKAKAPGSAAPKGTWWPFAVAACALAAVAAVLTVALLKGPAPGASASAPPALAPNAATQQVAAAIPPASGSLLSITNDHEHSDEGESGFSDAEIAVGLLTRGNEFLREGKFVEAVKEYAHSLRHDAGSEDTHYNMGIALTKLGREQEAAEHYKEALRILPDYAEAHNNLGNLLVKHGKLDDAIQHFNEAINLNPDSPSTQNNLGNALARKGSLSEATVHFAKAVQLQPDYVEAHYNLGNAYVLQNRIDEAAQQFTEVLRLQPDFTPALSAMARLREQRALGLRK